MSGESGQAGGSGATEISAGGQLDKPGGAFGTVALGKKRGSFGRRAGDDSYEVSEWKKNKPRRNTQFTSHCHSGSLPSAFMGVTSLVNLQEEKTKLNKSSARLLNVRRGAAQRTGQAGKAESPARLV